MNAIKALSEENGYSAGQLILELLSVCMEKTIMCVHRTLMTSAARLKQRPSRVERRKLGHSIVVVVVVVVVVAVTSLPSLCLCHGSRWTFRARL